MPSLKKTFYRVLGTVTRRPDWYVPMKMNKAGYRSTPQADSDLQDARYIMRNEPDFIYKIHQDIRPEVALTVYGRAGHPKNKFLIIGRLDRARMSDPARPVIDNAALYNFRGIDELAEKNGSILNSGNWTFYVNDMFITGGIANKRSFYLASPRTQANLTEEGRLTIFGREIAGLLMAGYEPHRLTDGSEAMIPGGGLRSLSIADYNLNVGLFNTPDIIAAMAHPNLIRIDYHPETSRIRPIISEF